MKAFILSAGQSKRFSEAGCTVPKHLLPMPDGAKLIEWQEDRMLMLGAHRRLRSGNFREALDVAEAQLAVKGTSGYRRTILLAARFEASQKLGQPAVGGKLTADTLEVLRRHGYSNWAEQLKTDHKL